jgi:hypothetical protein
MDSDGLEYLKKLDRFLNGEEQTTLYFELEKRGWTPVDPDGTPDEDINRSLTNLLWGLADLGVFVENADHLSDRELYKELLDYCDEPNVIFPDDPYSATHWSPIGGFSEEDIQVYLRYYCDQEQRLQWQVDYPDEEIPPAELPPYPRPWIPVRTFPDDLDG